MRITNEQRWISSTGFTLQWTKPADGGDPNINYTVEYSKRDSEGNFVLWRKRTGLTQQEYRLGRLVGGAEYEFRVTAVNSAGHGDAQAVKRFSVMDDGSVLPTPGKLRERRAAHPLPFGGLTKKRDRRRANWCINCVLMRDTDAVKETIADVSSVSPSSERKRNVLASLFLNMIRILYQNAWIKLSKTRRTVLVFLHSNSYWLLDQKSRWRISLIFFEKPGPVF